MEKVKGIVDRWVERVLNVDYLNHIPNKDSKHYEKALQELITLMLLSINNDENLRNDLKNAKDKDDVIKAFQTHQPYVFNNGGMYREVNRLYDDERKLARELLDRRRQENWATTRDHIKVFLFRVITAVVIGLVVLGINMLAHELGIPFTFIKVG